MKYSYNTNGTCSRVIDFEVENGILKNVRFTGGCHGNLQGIAALVEGLEVEDVIQKLEGIRCREKPDLLPRSAGKCFKRNSLTATMSFTTTFFSIRRPHISVQSLAAFLNSITFTVVDPRSQKLLFSVP